MEQKNEFVGYDPGSQNGDCGATVKGHNEDDGTMVIDSVEYHKPISFSPYRHGVTTHVWTEFLTRGKAGESIALAYPEGNFLSPKAVENQLRAKEIEVWEEAIKCLENLLPDRPKEYGTPENAFHTTPAEYMNEGKYYAKRAAIAAFNSKLAALKGEGI